MRSPRESSISGRAVEALTWEPVHFLMQRKMLLRIKELAERQSRGDPNVLIHTHY